MPFQSTIELFLRNTDRSGECWIWTKRLGPAGYGSFWLNGRGGNAHRFAYELFVGSIPEGLTIDHLCRVRACVNPSHLEAVTMRENLHRGQGWSGRHARVIACPYGHPFDEANTFVRPNSSRACRACGARRARERYARRKLNANMKCAVASGALT